MVFPYPGIVFRICGGIFFILAGLGYLGVTAIPNVVLGVFALIAGIALLVGA